MRFSAPNFALCSAALIAVLGTGAAAQQSEPTGGVQLTFGTTLRFETNDNADLNPVSLGSTQTVSTILNFGLLSETRTKRFALDLGGQLRYRDEPGATNQSVGLEKPDISLAYSQKSAAARFQFTASIREIDLSDATDPVTFITLDGTRRKSLVEARLNLRDGRPLGFGVFARAEDVSYGGPTAPLRVGYKRWTTGASTRLDFNDVSQLNFNLSHSVYDDDAAGSTRTTNDLTAALSIDRNFGIATGALGYTDTENGSRVTASVGHSFVLPYGEQSFSLGVTRGTTGTVYAIGTIDLAYDLPRGEISAGVNRRVSNNETDDTEELTTDLSLNYLQEISPVSTFGVGITWSENERTVAATSTKSTSINIAYKYNLTPDWQLSAGYKHKTRRLTGAARADSNLVFFQFKRQISVRY